MEKMKYMVLRLPHEWFDILKFASDAKEKNFSKFIRDILEKEVHKELKKLEQKALTENIYDPRIANFR